jgi:hypothetical protein
MEIDRTYKACIWQTEEFGEEAWSEEGYHLGDLKLGNSLLAKWILREIQGVSKSFAAVFHVLLYGECYEKVYT